MSFEETYQAEVLQSRRTRSQRAHFWAKITGFVLMLTIGVTLRSEPEFRKAIIEAGMDGVMAVSGRTASSTVDQPKLPHLPQTLATSAPSGAAANATDPNNRVRARPRDAVPVNRFGTQLQNGSQIKSILQPGAAAPTGPTADPTGMASDLGRLLQNISPGR